MNLFYEFLDWAKKRNWNIVENNGLICNIPAIYKEQIGDFENIIKKFKMISNSKLTTWFVVAECINNTDNDKFSWNEFMNISIDSCMDENEKNAVENWWRYHFPIVMSVKNGFYECYTIDTIEKKICYSSEPFFEEEEIVADSLTDFLKKIMDGCIDMD